MLKLLPAFMDAELLRVLAAMGHASWVGPLVATPYPPARSQTADGAAAVSSSLRRYSSLARSRWSCTACAAAS